MAWLSQSKEGASAPRLPSGLSLRSLPLGLPGGTEVCLPRGRRKEQEGPLGRERPALPSAQGDERDSAGRPISWSQGNGLEAVAYLACIRPLKVFPCCRDPGEIRSGEGEPLRAKLAREWPLMSEVRWDPILLAPSGSGGWLQYLLEWEVSCDLAAGLGAKVLLQRIPLYPSCTALREC